MKIAHIITETHETKLRAEFDKLSDDLKNALYSFYVASSKNSSPSSQVENVIKSNSNVPYVKDIISAVKDIINGIRPPSDADVIFGGMVKDSPNKDSGSLSPKEVRRAKRELKTIVRKMTKIIVKKIKDKLTAENNDNLKTKGVELTDDEKFHIVKSIIRNTFKDSDDFDKSKMTDIVNYVSQKSIAYYKEQHGITD